jgi:hypothetical protein
MNRNDEFTQALKDKGASNHCGRCNNTSFEVVGEQTLNVMRQGTGLVDSSLDQMQTIPTVLVSCLHCGNITMHSIVSLIKTKMAS